jgi:hypothetical protein
MKDKDNLYFGEWLGAPIPPPPSGVRFSGRIPTTRKQYSFRMYDVRCEQINGVWVPMAASYVTRLEQVDGRVYTSTTHCRRLTIDLKPNFRALGAFVHDVPDGTPVFDLDPPRKQYVWEGGSFKVAADNRVSKSTKKHVGDFSSGGTQSTSALKKNAEEVLKEALRKAGKDNKMVFVRLSSPGCVWCHYLSNMLCRKDVASILSRDFISLEIDLVRMKNGEKVGNRLQNRERIGGVAPIPWFAILDAEGKKLISSDNPEGNINIGCPTTADEISYFKEMLRKTAKNITNEQIETLGRVFQDEEAQRQQAKRKSETQPG